MLAERLVEVIGEAVKRLPEELRLRYSQTAWRKINRNAREHQPQATGVSPGI